jgi:hypothetical protein
VSTSIEDDGPAAGGIDATALVVRPSAAAQGPAFDIDVGS